MHIDCPKCQAVYDVPDEALPNEKAGEKPLKMRCFKCKAVFHVSIRTGPVAQPPAADGAVGESRPPMARPVSRAEEEEQLCIEVFDYSAQPPAKDPTGEVIPEVPAEPMRVVSRTSIWNAGNTLDLTGYATKGAMTIRRYTVACLSVALALIVLLFVFVAARNDWVLSFPNLSEQISIAFYGDDARLPPHEARALEVTVSEGYQLLTKDKKQVLVVLGQVFNPEDEERQNVMLNARIVSYEGKVFFEKRAPCGRVFKNRTLKRKHSTAIDALFTKKGEPYNCKIAGKKVRKFQIVFDNMTPGFDEKYRVEVKAVDAKLTEAVKGD